jgi:hypothetical protein
MFIVVRNPMYRLIALGVSVAIFAILYFTVIKSSNDTANNAVKQGLQQAQQQISNANKANPGVIPASATNLVNCVAAAGTDAGKLTACQAKYKQ